MLTTQHSLEYLATNMAVRLFCTAVEQLVGALRYKSEGRGFDSRWYHLNFFIEMILPAALWRGVDSASKRCEYQEYFLGGVKGAAAKNLTIIMIFKFL